ncbi:cation:dicarboxylase symporter family transporter [Sphingomonas ginkgonis]|uniref:Cation:dicarboxylase symporter family transporter n=1 Tax=Sphingomonas ginkgonis TaxID=2315330 RepID=A0A3S0EMF6_9SPHN|nr:cation:dicarboxylase symporter family transporter [Sphingomonas ginkgonis]RST30906.1 cation:dicarboxylase symporter family transporter [Sphingomonas ginkgonis]
MTGGGTVRILLALIGGILLGALSLRLGDGWREPLLSIASTVGGLWLDGLKMTVVPLIVALLVTGIVGSADAARAGGVAGRSMAWIALILTGSAIFGALVMPLLLGLFPLPQGAAAALQAGLAGVDRQAAAASVPSAADFVRSIVPTNAIAAAAGDHILQLVVFTALFAFAITRIDASFRRPLAELFEALAQAMLVIIGWILLLAPIGVFGLAFTVGAGAGGAALGAIAHYVALVASLGFAILLAGYAVAVLAAKWSPARFARAMIAPQAVAISTQSSLASLPAMLAAARELGVPDPQADVSLPLAVALMRATGPAMNMGVAIYVAHWLGIPLGPWQLAAGVVVAATTTYGTVSLPGQISFVTSIAPIALSMGVPVEPLALLIAVETLPDIFRTLGNVTMDVAMTGAVARRTAAAG